MDDADRVTEREEFTEKENRYRSHRETTTATATGDCLFCKEPVEDGRRWCNATCRDDWQSENEED